MNFFAHASAIIDPGARIGDGTKIWHFSHISAGAEIGQDCSLGQNVFVGGKAVIGRGCKIQNNVSVYDAVVLEDEVFVGPSAVFTNVENPRAFVERKDAYGVTRVQLIAVPEAGTLYERMGFGPPSERLMELRVSDRSRR